MSNRLAQELSPYLLQHKNNPVDWYPWGPEALERAKIENKPILLSIGYSACHWCHVMAHESFENASIAKIMNQHFINVKVDREERPDLDAIYQNVAQIFTSGGGWPLTVFLTPDLKPFFGGTYFPPSDASGRPGFRRILETLAGSFQQDGANVSQQADQITQLISQADGLSAIPSHAVLLDEGVFSALTQKILERVDWENGGMIGAPKFPNPMIWTYLWRYGWMFNDKNAQEATLLTLEKIGNGGIYDQLGGGFHRYSVDAIWTVPHFEKMLYDNALLLKLYSEILLSAGEVLSQERRELFLSCVKGTVEYVLREMTSSGGAFFNSQDADANRVEGLTFVWDLSDLKAAALSDRQVELAALFWGITEQGNFENKKTVLHRSTPKAVLRTQFKMGREELDAELQAISSLLWIQRKKRKQPGLDDKHLASWNGLMISGLCWAAKALRENREMALGQRAELAAQRAFDHSLLLFADKSEDPKEGRLLCVSRGGVSRNNAYLDDYAFLAQAALDLSRTINEERFVFEYLKSAQKWVQRILSQFKEPLVTEDAVRARAPGYFFTSKDHEHLILRPKTLFDQAIPSGTAVALNNLNALSTLAAIDSDFDLELELKKQWEGLSPLLSEMALGAGELLVAALGYSRGFATMSGRDSQKSCLHPHVFRKPGAAEPQFCFHKVCRRLDQLNLSEALKIGKPAHKV